MKGNRVCMRHRARGITLLELMIVVVIVGILATIAYPSYQEQVRQARRADAQTALLELAQFMERFYTTNGTYVGATLPFTQSPKDGGTAHYNLGFSAGPTATTFTLQAAPLGVDACGNLTLTNTGLRGRTGSAPLDRCWRN